MKHLFLLMIFIFAGKILFSQANAGLDKIVSKNKGTKIGTPNNPQFCYHWEATPADPSLGAPNTAQPEVHPTQTTTYKLTVTGTDFSSVTTDEVTVCKLSIDYFRHAQTGKEWKVVVGEDVEFKATAASNCTDWKWELKKGSATHWSLDNGNSMSGSKMHIPYTDLITANNDDFGETYGELTVSCKDVEGAVYTTSSLEKSNSTSVKVFFDPAKNVLGGEPSSSLFLPPCWFIFWKDGKVVDGMENSSYETGSVNYGSWSSTSGLTLQDAAWKQNSGKEELIYTDPITGVTKTIIMTGEGLYLDCLVETISHELHHKKIYELWGGNGPVALLHGHGDTDGLPDEEELQPSETFFEASDPNNHNTFGYDLYDHWLGFFTGYADNEVRCRIIETQKSKLVAKHPENDWAKNSHNPHWSN